MREYRDIPGAQEIESCYRPLPFWSWNDQLDEEELIRQIHEMHDAGMGGFFMHARAGLKMEYMGRRWMNAISVSVREAVKLGMKPWLYDENGWPSGFGNGEVNALGEMYQSKHAELVRVSEISDCRRVQAWYDECGGKAANPEEAYYALEVFVNPFYVDNLNPAVVEEFIRLVYERYAKELPADVRQNLGGIFTDEPQLNTEGIPWSPALSEAYFKEHGRALFDDFPQLVLEIGEWRRTRIAFWRLVTTLFRDSYIRRIGRWCHEHGWQLTGHHLMEESYDSQLNMNGALMPQYDGFSIPGIDHLYRVSSFTTAELQVVSAAAQNGQKQILVETFAGSGWNFNMKGMKWLYQQHLVLGVNLLCQHLAGYSLHGPRKRDYPASLSYQHPMFPHVRKLYDAFSRVGCMLGLGEIECEVMMLHGESSAWMRSHGHFEDRFSKELFQPFCRLSHALGAAGIPFHYGDEIMLSESGKVTEGRLGLGRMSYSVVVIPPVENVQRSTIVLLQELLHQGGRILRFVSPGASGFFVDGEEPMPEDLAFWEALPICRSEAEIVSRLYFVPALTIHALDGTPGRVRGTWRSFPQAKERWYYLADFAYVPENKIPDDDFGTELYSNIPEVETSSLLEITLPFPSSKAEIIDQTSGEVTETLALLPRPDGRSVFLKSLPATGSLLIRAENAPEAPLPLELTNGWQCSCHGNVMTLERVTYRFSDKEAWYPETDTISLFNRLLSLEKDTPLEICYCFEMSPELDPVQADLKIALEPDEAMHYFLNGVEIEREFLPETFIDRSIRILRLPVSALCEGTNRFEVRGRFHQRPEIHAALERAARFESEANKLFFDSEIEAVYLLGNFGCFSRGAVRKERANAYFIHAPFFLDTMPKTVDSGQSVLQGFPFFTGKLLLEKEVELTAKQASGFSRLCWSCLKASTIQVTVNGRNSSVIFAPPYEFNIAGLLKEGKNRIKIAVETSCRNTFGPFHTLETEPRSTSPGSFYTEPDLLGKYQSAGIPGYGVLEASPEKITLE